MYGLSPVPPPKINWCHLSTCMHVCMHVPVQPRHMIKLQFFRTTYPDIATSVPSDPGGGDDDDGHALTPVWQTVNEWLAGADLVTQGWSTPAITPSATVSHTAQHCLNVLGCGGGGGASAAASPFPSSSEAVRIHCAYTLGRLARGAPQTTSVDQLCHTGACGYNPPCAHHIIYNIHIIIT